ncbi:MAG: cupredoxin domain-containing protein [Proteobacteria bacterium]|nr:cupredoxin domain-containing protein [Pseudomonadota bacterium]
MRLTQAAIIAALALTAPCSWASAPPSTTITLTLADHRFSPTSISAPAGETIRIVLINHDGATEEFDSHDLRVEQLVTPHAQISFNIGPLRAGRYAFMGEFHPETAQGQIIAIERAR